MINVLVSPSDRELATALERSGARVSLWPQAEIDALAEDAALQEAIENLFGYDWLILKNARAAEYFLRAFFLKHRTEELDELRVLTIGTQTAEKLAQAQVHVDIALEEFLPAAVYREIESYVSQGGDSASLSRQNLLVPSASIITESFEDSFLNAGARVDGVAAYQTCAERRELIRLRTLLTGGGIDFVAFTGTLAIAEFAELFDTDDLGRALAGIKVVCLDQATSDLARKYGLSEMLVPSKSSIAALVQMITADGD